METLKRKVLGKSKPSLEKLTQDGQISETGNIDNVQIPNAKSSEKKKSKTTKNKRSSSLKEKKGSKRFWKKISEGNLSLTRNSSASSSRDVMNDDLMNRKIDTSSDFRGINDTRAVSMGADEFDSSERARRDSFTEIAQKIRHLMDSKQSSKSSEIINDAFNFIDSYNYDNEDETDSNFSTSISSSMASILSESNSTAKGSDDIQSFPTMMNSPSRKSSPTRKSSSISMSLPDILNMDEEESSMSGGSLVRKMTREDCVTMVLPNMEEKILPASKGATLRTALECLHQDVWDVKVEVPGSRLPLSINTELYNLRGTRLCIRARSLSLDAAVEATEASFRRRESINESLCDEEPDLNDDIFLQELSGDSSTIKKSKSKKASKETSVFYSPIELPDMEKMQHLLDHYSRNGIPHQPHILNFHSQYMQELREQRWQELVTSWEQLDHVQVQQQDAIWELVQSEHDYIQMLKVCQELFIACLCNLQNESLMFEIDTEKLFGNIQEVYSGNIAFWQDYIVKMLEKSRSTGEPMDPTALAEAFYKSEELFQAYMQHSLEDNHCQFYCKKNTYQNELFKTYLTWCESQPQCARLRLTDVLIAPMGRLKKYSVLLTPIALKTKENEKQLLLHEMIWQIDVFLSKINNGLNLQYAQNRLKEISNKIETCDIVDVRDDELEAVVRKHSSLNLTGPMPGCPEHLTRILVHRGELKIKDFYTSKMDVQVLLFTDMMLITKSMQKKSEKIKIIRPPYHIDYLEVVEVKDSLSIGVVYVNEWGVAESSFILLCPAQHEHRTWKDMVQRSKTLYSEAKQCKVRRKMTLT
ncbi:unnamed protein product [Meganyctiphanes norvegica]|uniref:DH domain-containing protein n=1 Tax=Meganyctiphanes norvegica TaxID=48144 RepID=A0AAV2QI23_MEGNR